MALNGVVLGEVAGDEFASAYFRIWLGTDPVSRGFKADVLSAPSEADVAG